VEALRAMSVSLPRDCAERYRVLEKLGEGGFGVVYLAQHKSLDRAVALKVLRLDAGESDESISRFLVEAEVTSRLRHRSIVRLLDFGAAEGTPWIAYERVEGRPLADVLVEGGPFPIDGAVRIVLELAEALQVVHERGIFHRDIKAENVMVTADDAVKLIDFGIAKVAGAARVRTETGFVLGSPTHMCPEQIRGEEVTPQFDLYALAVLLYHLLTGRLPFWSESAMALLQAQLGSEIPPPRGLRPEIPIALERFIVRALAKRADERFPDAHGFATELAASAGEGRGPRGAVTQVGRRGPEPRSAATLRRAPRASNEDARRAPFGALPAVVVAGAIACVFGAAWSMRLRNDTPPNSEHARFQVVATSYRPQIDPEKVLKQLRLLRGRLDEVNKEYRIRADRTDYVGGRADVSQHLVDETLEKLTRITGELCQIWKPLSGSPAQRTWLVTDLLMMEILSVLHRCCESRVASKSEASRITSMLEQLVDGMKYGKYQTILDSVAFHAALRLARKEWSSDTDFMESALLLRQRAGRIQAARLDNELQSRWRIVLLHEAEWRFRRYLNKWRSTVQIAGELRGPVQIEKEPSILARSLASPSDERKWMSIRETYRSILSEGIGAIEDLDTCAHTDWKVHEGRVPAYDLLSHAALMAPHLLGLTVEDRERTKRLGLVLLRALPSPPPGEDKFGRAIRSLDLDPAAATPRPNSIGTTRRSDHPSEAR
jgi:predicted Ser/Thr protein kinase